MRFLLIALLSITICPAQQRISAGNAASLAATVAPGSILDIQQLQPPRIIGNPDPNRVSVQVRPAGSSSEINAPLLAGSFLSIWAQLPPETPLGQAEVTLTVDGQKSAPAAITVANSSFGIFTQARNGLGPAIAQNQESERAPALNQLTNPALPNQYVILWGTGLGSARTSDVTVELGGRDIAPSYAGRAPDFPGVDQINFQIPPGLGAPDGCDVSVIVRVGDNPSNQATLSKAAVPGVCDHPLGLSAAEMATLDAGGRVLFGTALLQSNLSPPPRTESAAAQFLRRSALDIALLAQPLMAQDRYFGCSSTGRLGLTGVIFSADVDAGESLNLSGPGKTVSIPRSALGGLYAVNLDPPALDPGTWRFAGPGGATIGPFEIDIIVPPGIRWTNRDELAGIDRLQDQTVRWDPSGYTDADVVFVTLSLVSPGTSGIVCRTPAPAGSLTIPASLLQSLPSTSQPFDLQLAIRPRPNRRVVFPLPLRDSTTARGLIEYSYSESVRVRLR